MFRLSTTRVTVILLTTPTDTVTAFWQLSKHEKEFMSGHSPVVCGFICLLCFKASVTYSVKIHSLDNDNVFWIIKSHFTNKISNCCSFSFSVFVFLFFFQSIPNHHENLYLFTGSRLFHILIIYVPECAFQLSGSIAPTQLTIYRSNSKFNENLWCSFS